MRQMTVLTALVICLVGVALGQAGENHANTKAQGQPAVPTWESCGQPCQRGLTCQRLWQWMTYRPLPVPRHCQGCKDCPTSCPVPLYTYFQVGYPGAADPVTSAEK